MTEVVTNLPSIAGMLRGYSIEVTPSQSKVLDFAVERLDAGTEVFLAWIPGVNPMQMMAPAAKLRRAGLVPVPHVGARHLESQAQLEQLATRLAGDCGVEKVLIVGGDRAKPAGPYDCTLAVMRTEAFQKAGIFRMAVGGFPEGNPNISDPALQEALAAKVAFARSSGVEISVVTQFCFKAEPIIGWLQRIRDQGFDFPVRVGLAGPARLITLAHYAVHCGIGNSIHVLREHPSLAKRLTKRGPEPIIRDLAARGGSANGPALPLGIAGLHFFAFGGFNTTLNWINGLRSQ